MARWALRLCCWCRLTVEACQALSLLVKLPCTLTHAAAMDANVPIKEAFKMADDVLRQVRMGTGSNLRMLS